jgi:hypothetical protein
VFSVTSNILSSCILKRVFFCVPVLVICNVQRSLYPSPLRVRTWN